MSEEDNKNGWGGARAGAGRKKGSTSLLTAATLLKTIKDTTGKAFEEHLAEGYQATILNDKPKERLDYERMILGKVVSDKVGVEIEGDAITVEDRMLAFAEALKTVQHRDESGEL
jgi:hypothetical protein